MSRFAVRILCVASLLAVAACAPKPPPPPPPPPPAPVAVVIPPRPTPPNSAAPTLVVPARGMDGRFITPNSGVMGERAFWQTKIALNVAAIGCRGPMELTLVASYNDIIKNHGNVIRSTEKTVIRDLGRAAGTNGVAARDNLSTGLFNYFAQPPAQRDFCVRANEASMALAATPTKDVVAAAATWLPMLDQPFHDFYEQYAAYRVNLAAWDAQYGNTAAGLSAQPIRPISTPPPGVLPTTLPTAVSSNVTTGSPG